MAKFVFPMGVTATFVAVVASGMWQHVHAAEGAGATPPDRPGICTGYGPQSPRDIDRHAGTNAVWFPPAAPATGMNLCNFHVHGVAEHRATAFAVPSGEGAGFRCAISQRLGEAELATFEDNACDDIEPGDTIEVHWVYTTCDVAPGPGLSACLSEQCANPGLRVEAQVFTVVNDENAADFTVYSTLVRRNGFHQPAALPEGTGEPVTYLGSTTGPNYSDSTCSPLQVSWSVRPRCARLGIASLSRWCADNVFDEHHAHGARPLVTHPSLLSPIGQHGRH